MHKNRGNVPRSVPRTLGHESTGLWKIKMYVVDMLKKIHLRFALDSRQHTHNDIKQAEVAF